MSLVRLANATPTEQRADFYERLRAHNLAPLWEVLAELVTPAPITGVLPARWRFSEIEPFIEEAGALISAEEAERRVLILENPGLPGRASATSTLYAGLQVVFPGEVARAHRHAQSALRFILRGGGAFTALNGERVVMDPYDLVLTPNWIWHDHGNETAVPMVWLDGLDIPLIRSLDASFAEQWPGGGACPREALTADRQALWGTSVRPARVAPEQTRDNPIYRYPHALWRSTLEAQRSSGPPHPHDAYRVEFVNPLDGSPVMKTISAFAQLLPAGFQTGAMRSSDSSIHVVTEGRGRMVIDDIEFEIAEGDILVAPTWKQRVVYAESDLVLFSFSDKVTHQKLGLWREELL